MIRSFLSSSVRGPIRDSGGRIRVLCTGLGLLFSNADGVKIFGFSRNLSETEGEGVTIQPGQRIEISTRIENDLAVGRYTVGCYLAQEQSQPDFALGAMRLLDFVVFGTLGSAGVVVPDGEMEIRIAREP